MNRDDIRRLKANQAARRLFQGAANGAITTQQEAADALREAFPDVPSPVDEVVLAEVTAFAKRGAASGYRANLTTQQEADAAALKWITRIERANALVDTPNSPDDVDADATAGAVRRGNDPDWLDGIRFEDGSGLRDGE